VVGAALVLAACEDFTVEELQYEVDVINQSAEDIVNSPAVTVLTADGETSWEFAHAKGASNPVFTYLGGHYTVIVHASNRDSIDYRARYRNEAEHDLETAKTPAEAARLVEKIDRYTRELMDLYEQHTDSVSCTGTFPQDRHAVVQVVLLSETEAKIECGPGAPDDPNQ
jgi:hypothetical protein